MLDYDQPLDHFDGLTAFQATQKLGYPCHVSQQYTWFTRWINGSNGEITKAVTVKAEAFSQAAIAKIEAAGGKTEIIG